MKQQSINRSDSYKSQIQIFEDMRKTAMASREPTLFVLTKRVNLFGREI